jgi:hypothetical protein
MLTKTANWTYLLDSGERRQGCCSASSSRRKISSISRIK